MGDSTAEDLGFLTLNPLVHMDPIGIIVLFLFGAGWGRHVPINALNIGGKYRQLKCSVAFLADSFAHLVLATAVLIIFVLFFGVKSLGLYNVQTSSLVIAVARIIIAFIRLNIFLAVLSFAINLVMLFSLFLSRKYMFYASYLYYFVLFMPVILLLFFGEDLRFLLTHGVFFIGDFFEQLFGAA